ncbi:hypothetical protein PM082_019414 [Marasmius tenuissimus]|nr:hypothetical protein PM082_019414 [Marasmius tenuissimus]
MAVPPDFCTLDISGRFTMNKTLSDTSSIDSILSAQGVTWMLRKSIGLGTVTLGIRHYRTPSPSSEEEHIDITETLTPGNIKGTPDRRVLVWDQRVDTEDWIFGPVGGRTRRLAPTTIEGEGEGEGLSDDDVEWMKSGWTEDTIRDGIIHCRDESLKTGKQGKGWVVVQFWGIEVINAERRYTRHLLFTGGDGKVIRARFVYDYVGPL